MNTRDSLKTAGKNVVNIVKNITHIQVQNVGQVNIDYKLQY